MSKVLVTGGTGFIAAHCIKLLLERGYNVVTTVRSPEKGQNMVDVYSPFATGKGKISYQIVEDIAQKGAFDEVAKSVTDLDFVVHTASPFHYDIQDPVKQFLEPAVIGTTGILESVKNSSVKRVVILSSIAAMRDATLEASDHPPVYDETSFNPVTWDDAVNDSKKTYQGSKTLAEKAAWEFMAREKPAFDLVTVNPVLVLGPVAPHLTDVKGLNTSNIRILSMLRGEMKEELAPTGFYTWVDVRDVAYAHVRALEVPEAAGKRFILFTGYHTNKAVAKAIASMGPEYAKKLPSDLDALEDDIPEPHRRYGANNRPSIEMLGVKSISLEQSVRDTAESLIKLGV